MPLGRKHHPINYLSQGALMKASMASRIPRFFRTSRTHKRAALETLMQRCKRDKGPGDSDSSSSSTTSRSSQTSLPTITTTSTETATPTTTTTVITSLNSSGDTPSIVQSSKPTGGGEQMTSASHSQPSSQNLPSSSISSNPMTTVTISSSSSPSTSRPVFRFNDPANATLCSSFGLSWTYNGQTSVAMTLSIQQSVSQSYPMTTFGSPSGSPATIRILTTDVLSNADNFIWLSVDVMEGWYFAKAFDTAAALGISAGSAPFFVVQGSDTSCLLRVPTSTNASPPQITSSGSTGSKPSIGTGDIVGITLGVTAGAICLLLAVFTLPRLKRKDPSMMASDTKAQRPYLLY